MSKIHAWLRPSTEQQKRGIVAIYRSYHSIMEKGINRPYYQDTPYRLEYLARRYKRGGDMPKWITVTERSHDEYTD